MSSTYGNNMVRDGLIIYCDADNIRSTAIPGTSPGSYDWYDISRTFGARHDIYWNDQATYNSGGYWTFNGSSNNGSILRNTAYLSPADFDPWIYEQTLWIVMKHSTPSQRTNPWNHAYGGMGTMTLETSNYINYYYGTNGGDSTPYSSSTSPDLTTGVWNSICVTRDTSYITWYINGVQDTPDANVYGVLTNTTGDITIGYGYTAYYLAADLAMVMAWNKAISQAEHDQVFDKIIAPRFGL
jgi:hypothetical protein